MSAATSPDFNFAYLADLDYTANTKTVVANVFKTHPEHPPRFCIINGDFAYDNYSDSSTERKKIIDRWFSEYLKPLIDKKTPLWVTMGNHDVKEPEYYLNKFAATNPRLPRKWLYSFKEGSVYFLMLNTDSLHTAGSPQHVFAQRELEANKSATFKIVCFHRQIYSSDGGNKPRESFRHFHKLFDQYGVDAVLMGHNHNYERSFPISYNKDNTSRPIVNDDRKNDYVDPLGQVYVVAGTAGRKLYEQDARAPHFYTQYYGWGHMRFRIMEQGTRLQGRFYDKSLKIRDEFSIKKTV